MCYSDGMELYLHNTLTGKKERFEAIEAGRVGMYNCGPTVYDYAHIGNLRAYVFVDILRRTLEWNGYAVRQIMNITDIGHLVGDGDDGEDKMTLALKREGKPLTLNALRDVANKYTKAFEEDLVALNIEHPTALPHASEHVPAQQNIIAALMDKGIAYATSDGVYFDTTQFPNYGKLGNVRASEQKEGARVEANPEKKHHADFALWKFSEHGFDAPWGKGFPGWHIECSAMSMEYLGDTFDIHTGGIDHIGTHHNNEIAQSESYTGKPLAHFWLHNAHITLGKEKIAKSLGNTLTLRNLVEKGYPPLSYRYLLLTAHYRTPMQFSWEALDAAREALKRLYRRMQTLPDDPNVLLDDDYVRMFSDHINDDLDTPQALALLWKTLKDTHLSPAVLRKTLLSFDDVLGLGLVNIKSVAVPEDVQELVSRREEARQNKNFEEADRLREEVKEFGFDVSDTSEGPEIYAQ